MTDIQTQVQQAIDQRIDAGLERGVQVAVYRHGRQVVDAVAGAADLTDGRQVTPGTVFNNFSIGKGVTASVVHVLAEEGLLRYDTPVAELWPQFAAHGKQDVTIRHVLTHAAGVPGLPPDITPQGLCDWDAICAAIADERLWWEPGTKSGHHAYTFGYILGEVVRRVTGKPISQVLRERVAGPLGVTGELYFGVPRAQQYRLARLEDAVGALDMMAALPDDLPSFRAMPRAVLPTARLGNMPDVLAADIPAVGRVSARAVARVYAALLGEVDGVRLISPDRLDEVTAVAASGEDAVMGPWSAWGVGYAIGRLGADVGDTLSTFGMAGAGGSYAYADRATGIAFGLTKNMLTPDFETATLIARIVSDAFA